MNDLLLVQVRQGVRDGEDDRQRVMFAELLVRLQVSGQAWPIDEFHHQVRNFLTFAVFEDLDEMLMGEWLDGSEFNLETPAEVRVAHDDACRHLDGDDGARAHIARLVDAAHAALSDLFQQFVIADSARISAGRLVRHTLLRSTPRTGEFEPGVALGKAADPPGDSAMHDDYSTALTQKPITATGVAESSHGLRRVTGLPGAFIVWPCVSRRNARRWAFGLR